jgi:hypothetical protein
MSYNPLTVGSQLNASSISLVTNYSNASSVDPIPQGAPVSLTGTADQIAPTDVTSQTSVSAFVGVAQFRIAPSGNGPVLAAGRLLNLTGFSFSIGDSIWISISGSIQNMRPDDGVTGFGPDDYVYSIGTIAQNESNALQQDLIVMPQLMGQL